MASMDTKAIPNHKNQYKRKVAMTAFEPNPLLQFFALLYRINRRKKQKSLNNTLEKK